MTLIALRGNKPR